MSQLTAVDISDSDRFELADVLKEESESSSAPRALEDILQETCDDDFDPMSQRSCYELRWRHILRDRLRRLCRGTVIPPARIAGPVSRITFDLRHIVRLAERHSASDSLRHGGDPSPPKEVSR